VKGYEVGQGDYVVVEPEEIAAAVPDSDKTLACRLSFPVRMSTTSILTAHII
jgi:DNA end-binding protein Ku